MISADLAILCRALLSAAEQAANQTSTDSMVARLKDSCSSPSAHEGSGVFVEPFWPVLDCLFSSPEIEDHFLGLCVKLQVVSEPVNKLLYLYLQVATFCERGNKFTGCLHVGFLQSKVTILGKKGGAGGVRGGCNL